MMWIYDRRQVSIAVITVATRSTSRFKRWTPHGLSIDGYDVNRQAEPGQSAYATFVANNAGSSSSSARFRAARFTRS